jgi:hypothetical protein
MAATRAARQAAEDAERDDGAAWRAYISSEIRGAIVAASSGIAEHLAEEWSKVGDALVLRDRQIGKLEVELARTQAELARLTARVIQSEIASGDGHAKTIDLPNPLPTRRREGLN